MSVRRLLVGSILIVSLASCVNLIYGQEAPRPTRLALEVTFYPGRNPSYQSVLAANAKGQGTWYAMLKRIESWRASGEIPNIRAVRLVPHAEGEGTRVVVSVMWGEKALDGEKPIGNYLIQENETISVEELKEFGIEPFRIKLVRLVPNIAPIPDVTLDKISSLVVLNVVSADATLPYYRLTLSNQSNKDIVGLALNVMTGRKTELSGRPRERFGQVLIGAGKTREITAPAPVRSQETAAGFAPAPLIDHQIQIRSVVFADGTFEGDPASALEIRSFREGEKMELPGLIAALDQALKSSSTDTIRVLRALEAEIDDLNTNIDPALQQRLASEFSQLGGIAATRVKSCVEIAAIHTKTDLVNEIHKIETDASRSGNTSQAREWLQKTRDIYTQWLARL